MKSDKQENFRALTAAVLLMVPVVVLGVAILYLHGFAKAKAFHRVTGVQVSTWEAMYLDLRVVGSPKEGSQ